MWFGRKSPEKTPMPPHVLLLIEAMQRITRDTLAVANSLRRGEPLFLGKAAEPHLVPIRIARSEELFSHRDEKGTVLYSTYYFTKDLKRMNIGAQYYLHIMYGRIFIANSTATKSAVQSLTAAEIEMLKNLLDEILVKSIYFQAYFRGFERSTAFLMNRVRHEDRDRTMKEHLDEWTQHLIKIKDVMFFPENLRKFMPDEGPCFLLQTSQPYEQGQRIINGVYFSKEHAELILAQAIAAQSQTLSNAQPS